VWHGLAVGGAAGIIHGHSSITGRYDPLCSPHPLVRFAPGGGTVAQGGNIVGDYYKSQMTTEQETPLRACTGASIDEVARRLGANNVLGLTDGGSGALARQDCFDQRVTNDAWVVGLTQTNLQSAQLETSLVYRFLSRMVPRDALTDIVLRTVIGQARAEVTSKAFLADIARWKTGYDPDGLQFANLELDSAAPPDTLMGMQRNRAYVDRIDSGLVTFDPKGDVIAGAATAATPKHEEDAEAIRLAFHKAHTDHWCEDLTADQDVPDNDLERMQKVCSTASDEDAREAGCAACTEFGLRFHRDAEDLQDWYASGGGEEPLCSAYPGNQGYLYVPVEAAQTRREAVEGWCRGAATGWAVSDSTLWLFDPAGTPGKLADTATQVTTFFDAPRGLAGTADRAFMSTTKGDLVAMTRDGVKFGFTNAGCEEPRGLTVDEDGEYLYVACRGNHTVMSFDLATSIPTLVDSIDLSADSVGGVGEEPYDLSISPDGSTLAVSTYEGFAQRDGVTLIDLVSGTLGTAVHVETTLMFDPGWVNMTGAFFAQSGGVTWLDGSTLLATNFGRSECAGGAIGSCEVQSGYWVTRVDAIGAIATQNLPVASRTLGAATYKGYGLAAVYGATSLGVASTTGSALTASVPLSQFSAQDVAVHEGGERIFVTFADASCGLAVIDASDSSPSAWSVLAEDVSMYCPRYVAIVSP